jgi:hypothetical protein
VTLLVYALADPSLAVSRLRGLAGEPLRAVTIGKVAAVIGSVRQPPAATTGQLHEYDAIMRALSSKTRAILPARYGTAMSDIAEIEQVLDRRQQPLRRALRHVRGRAQMTVRVIGTASREAVARPAAPPHPVDERPGAAYLRERAAEAARLRHVPGFERVRASVDRFVRDERVEKRGDVASVYHLIPRAAAASYRRAMDVAARQSRLRVVISGPWPPYAFTEA